MSCQALRHPLPDIGPRVRWTSNWCLLGSASVPQIRLAAYDHLDLALGDWQMLMKIVAATGAAALVATAPAHAQTHTQAPADHWTFSITPYLWLPNVNGTLNYSAPPGVQASPQVEVGPNDYLSDLKAAALIAGEAGKGPWAIFTDVMYLKFDSQDSQVQGINFVSVGRNPVSSSLKSGHQLRAGRNGMDARRQLQLAGQASRRAQRARRLSLLRAGRLHRLEPDRHHHCARRERDVPALRQCERQRKPVGRNRRPARKNPVRRERMVRARTTETSVPARRAARPTSGWSG